MNEPSIIFLDIDEVLGQWIKKYLSSIGMSFDQVPVKNKEWDVFSRLDIPKQEAWNHIISLGEKFWEDIEIFPWTYDLVKLCQKLAQTSLLTACVINNSNIYAGKCKWIKKHLPGVPHLMGIGCKSIVASEKSLLIDDSPINCENFIKNGGNALLFPSFFNDLNHIKNPYKYICEKLYDIFPSQREVLKK